MVLETESHYKYRTLALNVLAKALDDICPKYEGESEDTRQNLIKERIEDFTEQEKLIDKEWKTLEKEAQSEVNNLKKERLQVIKKIEKTRKTLRIKMRLQQLTRNKNKRIKYLEDKLRTERTKLERQLNTLKLTSKKYVQIKNKLNRLVADTNKKIDSVSNRYNKIIANTKNSDNSSSVDARIQQSHQIWERKFQKLKEQFAEKEAIHENRRFEVDTIRITLEDFVDNLELIKHWCLIAGVPTKTCYLEVKERLNILGRKSLEIEDIVEKL